MIGPSLLSTFLELGHATSQNLEYAQTVSPKLSYGEETITETNLLEIRRRHPQQVKIQTFSKFKESSLTGADWEWHIIGKRYTLKMRVQAKRILSNGAIHGLSRRTKRAPASQIDLLINDARSNGLRPIYCFYCSEAVRSHWNVKKIGEALPLEFGCLLADADMVKSQMPKKLKQIEPHSIPWHFLFSLGYYGMKSGPYFLRRAPQSQHEEMYLQSFVEFKVPDFPKSFLPTASALNGEMELTSDQPGVHETAEEILDQIDEGKFRERGVSMLLTLDVRNRHIFGY